MSEQSRSGGRKTNKRKKNTRMPFILAAGAGAERQSISGAGYFVRRNRESSVVYRKVSLPVTEMGSFTVVINK